MYNRQAFWSQCGSDLVVNFLIGQSLHVAVAVRDLCDFGG